MSQLVRIDDETHAHLQTLAKAEGAPLGRVLGKALEAYEEKKFWESFSASVEALRNDPKAWAEELEERALWEAPLGDGLEDDPYP